MKVTLIFLGLLAGSGLILLLSVLGDLSLLGEVRLAYEGTDIAQERVGSHCFIIPATYGGPDLFFSVRSRDALLLENGRPLGPANSAHEEIRIAGGGRFSHWKGSLYFSSSDNTDPRTNGRIYELIGQRRVPAWLVLVALPVFAVTLGWLAGRSLWRRGRDRIGRQGVRTDVEAGLVFLFALGTAVPWLVLLPPTWLYADSVVQMLYSINEFVIPHFPPFYPVFTRTVNYVVTGLLQPGSPAAAPWGSANLSDASLYTIIALQQLLWAGAVAYFACGAAMTLRRRLLAVLPFYLVPAISLYNHGIATDGPWASGLIVMVGASYRILQDDRILSRHHLTYFAAMFFAMMTRHTAFVFAFLLPASILGLTILERAKWRQHLVRVVCITVLSFAMLPIDHIVNVVACQWAGVTYRSTVGRVGVLKIIWTDWNAMPEAQRRSVEEAIEAKCSEPLVAGAVPVIFEARVPRGDQLAVWHLVEDYLLAHKEALHGRDPSVLSDDILTEVYSLYSRSWGRWYREGVWAALEGYGRMLKDKRQSDEIVDISKASLEVYAKPEVYPRKFFASVSATDPALADHFVTIKANVYYRLVTWWTDVRLLLLLAALLVVGVAGGGLRARHYLFCAASLVNVGLYFLVLALITWSFGRYALAASIIEAPLLGIVLANLHLPRWSLGRS